MDGYSPWEIVVDFNRDQISFAFFQRQDCILKSSTSGIGKSGP